MAEIGLTREAVRPPVTTSRTNAPFAHDTDGTELCGIDWCTLTFIVSRPTQRYEMWARKQGHHRKSPDLSTGARLSVERHGNTWAVVSFNPSRVVDAAGWRACPPAELPAALDKVWADVEPYVKVVDGWCVGDALVKRLDVTRDFEGVEFPALYPRTFGLAEPGKDRCLRGGTTLEIGRRHRHQVVLYDKHEAPRHPSPAGVLRFEVRASSTEGSSSPLRRCGIERVSDLTGQRTERLASESFQLHGFGNWLCAGEALFTLPRGLSADDQNRMLGAAVRLRRFGDTGLSSRSDKEMRRRIRREIGWPVPDLLAAGLPDGYRRLDWSTGTEVCEPMRRPMT